LPKYRQFRTGGLSRDRPGGLFREQADFHLPLPFRTIFPQRESSHMPLDEATLKRQLDLAKAELAVWVKKLDSNKVAATARRKDATWRKLNAACNTIKTRLKAVAVVKARDEAVAQHKVEKLSAVVVEKEPKKAGKEPKAKEKAPKKEKGEGKKPEKGHEPKEKKKKE
jgi:hypothetical protein